MQQYTPIGRCLRFLRRYNRYIKVSVIAIIALTIALLPTTIFGIPGLTPIQQRMIAIFVWAALMWIIEAVPAWTTSLLIIVIMLLTVSDSSLNFLKQEKEKTSTSLQHVSKIEKGDTLSIITKQEIAAEMIPTDASIKEDGILLVKHIAAKGENIDSICNRYSISKNDVYKETVTKKSPYMSYKDIMGYFANPTVMLFMGGFILALVASKSGVDISMARAMLKPFGSRPKVVLFGFIIVTAIFSMFVSNTATAAMMLTFLAPVLRQLPANEKGTAALALAIPIGANIGGLATPIGTPPNGIALQYINDPTGLNLNVGFGEWMTIMTPLVIVILIISWLLLSIFYPFTSKEINIRIIGGAKKGWRTSVIYGTLAVTILLWMFESLTGINSYVVALIPIGVFAITRIIKSSDLKDIDWACLWMVAGGFALGDGMKKTGLAQTMVDAIPFDSWPVLAVVLGGGVICWLLSQFISNSAATALMVPLMVAVGSGMQEALGDYGGVGTLLVGVAMAASFAMSLPISTPPNAIAYSTGLIKTKQMFITGMTIGIISLIIGYVLIISVGKTGYFG
ncbi:MAG: SLC13/DASS family transporter [Bacteroidaceae bacterium]|nr:SLC13/DASS family transporter [Bacteroidaceae bacterium]